MSELAYSYHTFLFPFLWNDGGKTRQEDFIKVLSVGKRWFETLWQNEKIPNGIGQTEWLQYYAAYQYFTEPANAAIFNPRGENVVRCFEYRHNGSTPEGGIGKYIIIKESGDYPITAELDINNIRMHIYDSGVAIFILELENRQHRELDAVNKINEFGRRINMPYLVPGGAHSLCADRIEIRFGEELFEKEDYFVMLKKLGENFNTGIAEISLNYIMQPIQKFIDGGGVDNGGYEVTTKADNARKDPKKLFIKPCVDDRMFVCCLVVDGAFANRLSKYNAAEKEYHYLTDCDMGSLNDAGIFAPDNKTISNDLYKLCYIETWVTCQSVTMKRELLKQTVYDRWIDYGTIHAMTHHSLLCVSTDEVTINAFLTEYVQLAILVLAQRATILALSGEAATVAEGLRDDTHITPEQIGTIERLQAKYVKSQNQLLLSEATVQEQGVEIYNRIKKQLYIDTNKAELDSQMNNLRDVANISNDRLEQRNSGRLNNILAIVSAFALVLAVLEIAPSFYSDIDFAPYRWGSIGVSIFVAAAGVGVFTCVWRLLKWLYRKIKKK